MTHRAHDQPLCPEGDFRFWTGVGASALGIYLLGCLGGVGALMPRIVGESAIIQRLSAAGAAVVWIALCTAAGSMAFAALSLVRGRPAGSAFDIASRTFACVAVAMLAHDDAALLARLEAFRAQQTAAAQAMTKDLGE